MAAFDLRVFLYLHDALAPALWLFVVLSALGGGWGALIAFGLMLWRPRLRPMARFLAYTLAANAVFVYALKALVARVRPCNCLPGIHARFFVAPSDYSFPSGHSAGSFAFAVFFAVLLVRSSFWTKRSRIGAAIGLLVLAFGVGLSRIALGVHFPGDVLAGALVGATFGGLGGHLYLRSKSVPKTRAISS